MIDDEADKAHTKFVVDVIKSILDNHEDPERQAETAFGLMFSLAALVADIKLHAHDTDAVCTVLYHAADSENQQRKFDKQCGSAPQVSNSTEHILH